VRISSSIWTGRTFEVGSMDKALLRRPSAGEIARLSIPFLAPKGQNRKPCSRGARPPLTDTWSRGARPPLTDTEVPAGYLRAHRGREAPCAQRSATFRNQRRVRRPA